MKIAGSTNVEEVVGGYDKIFDHVEFHSGMHAVWDLSTLNLTAVPLSEVRQLPRELRKYMERRGEYKAALVLTRSTDYQLMRIYLTILKLIGSNIRFRLCRSLDEAYRWIEE